MTSTVRTGPKRIEAHQTSDGKVFTILSAAEHWQVSLNGAVVANRMLESGANLRDCMLCGGLASREAMERMPELAEVTKDTKLIIRYWQCRDEPGYRPSEIQADGDVFVYGDAGSWSGPYGNACSLRDIVTYWADTKARAQRGY